MISCKNLLRKNAKNLKRERREALSNNIEIEWATADVLTEDHWDAFYRFYLDTGQRKWGSPYLTRAFFSGSPRNNARRRAVDYGQARRSLHCRRIEFYRRDTLFGRNWGCIEDHRFLHFEVCYYQAIDFAIHMG